MFAAAFDPLNTTKPSDVCSPWLSAFRAAFIKNIYLESILSDFRNLLHSNVFQREGCVVIIIDLKDLLNVLQGP